MRPSLSDLLDQTKQAAEREANAEINTIGARSPAPIRPRTYASPEDVYDQDVGYQSPFMNVAPGVRRPMWQVPPVAITHSPINTLKSSSVPVTTQATQVVGAGQMSGVVASNSWSTVPNMELSVVANGPVNMSATVPVQSTSASDAVQFAFYRGFRPLSQIFSHTTTSTVNTPTIVTLSFTDPSPLSHSLLNLETYSLFWKGPSGNISSPGVGRTMYLNSLIPS